MLENVITIVSAQAGHLSGAQQAVFISQLKSLGVDRVEASILDKDKAVDIYISGSNPELIKILREKLPTAGFDIFIQPNNETRKKLLFLADMDATIIQGETLDDLAELLNLKDKIAPITARAMRGELDFHEALRMRIKLLKGMPITALSEAIRNICYTDGAKTLVRTLRRHGTTCVLISGGFDMFTGHVADSLGFHKNFGNRLEIAEARLTGEVIPPIVDKDVKKKTVETEARALGIDLSRTLAVGDGANDIPMLQTAGVGVGYFGKPAVQAATPFQVRYTDLTSLLYLQGYRREEFAN